MMKLSRSRLEYVFATTWLMGFVLVHEVYSLSFSSVLSGKDPSTVNVSLDTFESDQSAASNYYQGTTQQQTERKSLSDWSEEAGINALRQVQTLASKVAESTDGNVVSDGTTEYSAVAGEGGTVFSKISREARGNTGGSILRPNLEVSPKSKRQEQVWSALANLELDSKVSLYLAFVVPSFVFPHKFLAYIDNNSAISRQYGGPAASTYCARINVAESCCRCSCIGSIYDGGAANRIRGSYIGCL
jgi:hypothetical protein